MFSVYYIRMSTLSEFEQAICLDGVELMTLRYSPSDESLISVGNKDYKISTEEDSLVIKDYQGVVYVRVLANRTFTTDKGSYPFLGDNEVFEFRKEKYGKDFIHDHKDNMCVLGVHSHFTDEEEIIKILTAYSVVDSY